MSPEQSGNTVSPCIPTRSVSEDDSKLVLKVRVYALSGRHDFALAYASG